MNTEIKKCADENDIKGLRYIFVDCLDVDPTFESYKEDYEYCKNLKGLFVEYEEITPLKNNSSGWNEDYWVKLKVDLLKNFSEKRFFHMIKVAKVVKADKVRRLQQERLQTKTSKNETKNILEKKNNIEQPTKTIVQQTSFNADEQQKNLEAKQKELQLEYQKTQAKIDRENKERAKRAERLKAEELARKQHQQGSANNSSKKVVGIVALVAVVILIIVLVMLR